MKKRLIIGVIIAVVVVLLAVLVWRASYHQAANKLPAASQPILYWGNGCSHCAKVEEFIKDQQIENKVKFERKEVFNDQANAQELVKRATECGLNTSSIGVPFLYDVNNTPHCLVGEPEVTNYFKQKANVQ